MDGLAHPARFGGTHIERPAVICLGMYAADQSVHIDRLCATRLRRRQQTGSTSRDLITDDRVEHPRNLRTGTKGPADSKSVSDHFKWVFCLCYVRREVFEALGADALLLG
jgi:hypothetical protein